MSSTCSAGSGDSASASSEPECGQSHSARLTPTPAQSSASIGPESPATTTCEPSAQLGLPLTGSDPLMLSAGGSPARTSARQERAQDSPGSGRGYGRKSPVWLANYDRDTSSWKTSQHCLVEGLATYSETWPRSGMTRNGTAYQLPTLVPLTDGTGSGLLATPTQSDIRGPCKRHPERADGGQPNLAYQVRYGMWPTPRANQAMAATITPESVWKPDRNPNIETIVGRRMWPTPTSRDWKGGRKPDTLEASGRGFSNTLNDALTVSGQFGQLNPTWVEWLMGFPLGWTALDASEMP